MRIHHEYGLTLSQTIPGFQDFEKKKRLLKTLWEKEKMLVTSIFTSSHNVFSPLPEQIDFVVDFVVCICLQYGPNLSFGKGLRTLLAERTLIL